MFKKAFKHNQLGDHVCKDCFDKWDEVEKKLFFLGNRVQELEATWLEALEEDDSEEEKSFSLDKSSDEVMGTPKLSRKSAEMGKSLMEKLKELKK